MTTKMTMKTLTPKEPAPIPLADAIDLGAMLHRQSFQSLYTNGRTCALGAALEAVGVDVKAVQTIGMDTRTLLRRLWPEQRAKAKEYYCPHPNCGDFGKSNRFNVIVHLNDDHHWTRKKIAEWVRTTEPRKTQAALAKQREAESALVQVEV